jgi:hypothetical protein
MTLTPTKKYRITIMDQFTQDLTLIRIGKVKPFYYDWLTSENNEISNRMEDVERWIKFGRIEIIL